MQGYLFFLKVVGNLKQMFWNCVKMWFANIFDYSQTIFLFNSLLQCCLKTLMPPSSVCFCGTFNEPSIWLCLSENKVNLVRGYSEHYLEVKVGSNGVLRRSTLAFTLSNDTHYVLPIFKQWPTIRLAVDGQKTNAWKNLQFLA